MPMVEIFVLLTFTAVVIVVDVCVFFPQSSHRRLADVGRTVQQTSWCRYIIRRISRRLPHRR